MVQILADDYPPGSLAPPTAISMIGHKLIRAPADPSPPGAGGPPPADFDAKGAKEAAAREKVAAPRHLLPIPIPIPAAHHSPPLPSLVQHHCVLHRTMRFGRMPCTVAQARAVPVSASSSAFADGSARAVDASAATAKRGPDVSTSVRSTFGESSAMAEGAAEGVSDDAAKKIMAMSIPKLKALLQVSAAPTTARAAPVLQQGNSAAERVR